MSNSHFEKILKFFRVPLRLQLILKNRDYFDIISKGASYIFIKGAGLILSFIFTIYITKYYGASIFGLFSWSLSVFMIISVVGRLGLDLNVVKHYSIEKNEKDIGLFWVLIAKTFLFSSFISWGLYYYRFQIIDFIFEQPKPEIIPYLNWALICIPFWNAALVCAGIARAKTNIKMFTFISLSSRFIFSLLFLLVLVSFFENTEVIAIAHFFGVLITCVIAFIYAVKRLSKLTVKSTSNSWVFLKESLPMMLSASTLILLGWIDTFIMGIYETDSNVGIYNVCIKIATITTFTLLAVNSILAPKIARYYQEQEEGKYKSLINFSAKLNFYSSIVVIILILIFSNSILFVFGEEFTGGQTILIILCLGQLVNSLSGPVGIVLQMIGKQKIYQNFVLISLLINILLTFWLTPKYGGIGAAIATIISMTFWNLASVIYLKIKLNITSYFNPFITKKNA